MIKCANCRSDDLKQVIDLGNMPLANALLTREQLPYAEPFYSLRVVICPQCSLMQLERRVAPENLFADYAYFSSYSKTFLDQNRQHADQLIDHLGLNANSFVVEIGSNDGYMLRNFVERGIPALGIEPAPNVAKIATDNGIPTAIAFFNEQVANLVRDQHGPADLIIANNVLAHIPDLHSVAVGIRTLLAPNGLVSIEVPYAARLLQRTQFDTIYHEHVYYFTLSAIQNIFRRYGLGMAAFHEIPNHGGSLRVYVKRGESALINEPYPLDYELFAWRAQVIRDRLREFLVSASLAGKTVVGFGAPAKATILLNYCGIGPDLISYLVDDTPYKQGRFVPGTRTPIYSVDRLRQTKPDYIMIMPWNHATEIRAKLAFVAEWGARILLPYGETIDGQRHNDSNPDRYLDLGTVQPAL